MKNKDKLTKDDTLKIEKVKENGKEVLKAKVSKDGKLKLKIKELEEEIKILNNELLKKEADKQNYKKHLDKLRQEDIKYANMALIETLLTPLDQLNQVVSVKQEDKKLNNYLIGFKMINDQIFTILTDLGLKEIKSVGEKFDPNYHNAIELVNNKSIEDDIITKEILKGYTYKDRLLRAANVVVNERKDKKSKK